MIFDMIGELEDMYVREHVLLFGCVSFPQYASRRVHGRAPKFAAPQNEAQRSCPLQRKQN